MKTGFKEITIFWWDGAIEIRKDGNRNWRNNNPGNVTPGYYASLSGAIGDDDVFSIFPDVSSGNDAMYNFLGSVPYLYEKKRGDQPETLDEAIYRYAPPPDNDTPAYQAYVHQHTGISGDTLMIQLSEDERLDVMEAMKHVEGFYAPPGTVTKK
jgi:hypothetical protein